MFPDNQPNRELAKRIFLNQLDECRYFPRYFEIETIHACNACCIMCSVNDWEKGKSVLMPDSLYTKFVEEVSCYKDWIQTICLNRDGEPTLDKKISQRVKMLKDAGIKKVTLTTNGQLLNPELSKELIQSGLDDIMVSIDGITKATFERIRIGLNYETVVDNTLTMIQLRNESKSPLTIRIRMVILEENRHEVDAWIQFWAAKVNNQDRVYAMPAHTWGNQVKITGVAENEANGSQGSPPCVFVFSSIAMHADGKVGLCNVDYNAKYEMGDFQKNSIKEIWTGKTFSRVRELHANGRANELPVCNGCNLWNREFTEAELGKK